MSAAPKTRAEHKVIHQALVAKGSPLADTYYAIHCVPTREQATQRAATVDYPDVPNTGSTKPESKRTAHEQYAHLVATGDPRAEVFAACNAMAINATRPAEGDAAPAAESPHPVHLGPPATDEKEPLP